MANSTTGKRKRAESEASATPDDDNGEGNDRSDNDDSSPGRSDHNSSDEETAEEEADIRYDASKEELPFTIAYDPAFHNIEHMFSKELERYKKFDEGIVPCAEMMPLLQRYQATKLLPQPRPTTIGLIGNAGTGKSSLINSVLDCSNLAEAGASGSSCTSVVTEFCAASPEQKENFAAEIIYVQQRQAEQLLRHQLSDVLLMRHAEEEKWTKIEQDEHRQKVTTAIATFCTIFPDMPGFGSEDDVAETLTNVTEDTASDFLQPLFQRCEELINESATTHLSASSATRLNKKLAAYTRPNASSHTAHSEPALWPLVEKVKITLRNWHVCNGLRHLIFADLPGLQDENLVRVEAAKAYLSTCDAVWVVTPIDRVKDNADTARLLDFALARHPNKVALIVTKSDTNLDQKTYAGLKGTEHDTADCQNRLVKIKEQQRRLIQLEKKLRKKWDRAVKSELLEAKKNLIAEIDNNEMEFSTLLMRLRNKSVEVRIRRNTIGKVAQGTRLPVFCVSNCFYQQLQDSRCSALKFSAIDTGIPALRYYALELPTTNIYKCLKRYMTGPYHEFIEGLQSWTKGELVANSEELLKMIHEKKALAVARTGQYNDDMDAMVEDLVFNRFKQNAEEYSEIALGVSKRIEISHSWQQYRQICKFQGSLNNPSGKKISWNEMLVDHISKDMSEPWSLTGHKQSIAMGMAVGEIAGHMRSVALELKTPRPNDPDLENLCKTVEYQIQNIQDTIIEDFVALSALMRDLSVRMTRDVHESMVVSFMKATYEKCGAEVGVGTKKRMHQSMHDHMSQEGKNSFAYQILRMARKEYYAGRRKSQLSLADRVGAMFNSIAVSCQLLATEKTKYDPVIEEFRKEIAMRIDWVMDTYSDNEKTLRALELAASGLDS